MADAGATTRQVRVGDGSAGALTGTAAKQPRPRKGAARRQWMPPQHGVWAMLLLPYLVGLQWGRSWLQVPLLVVWLSGWLASYYGLLALKTLRIGRYWRQVLAYGIVAAVAALPLFVLRPGLLWFAPAFAVLLGVNALSTRKGQERSSGNGIASVTMASLMAMIAAATAGLGWRIGIGAAIACWLYLAGSVFYVKTMIRAHGSRVHRIVSVAFHIGALAGAVAVEPWLAVPFAWFAVRAAVLPRWRIRVVLVGLLEVANSLLLLGLLLWRL